MDFSRYGIALIGPPSEVVRLLFEYRDRLSIGAQHAAPLLRRPKICGLVAAGLQTRILGLYGRPSEAVRFRFCSAGFQAGAFIILKPPTPLL
jgi:hypothetical protein